MAAKTKIILTSVLLATVIMALPSLSLARDQDRDYRRNHGKYHDRGKHEHDRKMYLDVRRFNEKSNKLRVGLYVDLLPRGSVVISYGKNRYYYKDGNYYRRHSHRGRPRYIVIEPPPTIVYTQPQVLVAKAEPAPAAEVKLGVDESYTINIPNEKHGGYVQVTLKRSGEGFVGPQGEFYEDFPTVNQLKVVYVKG